MIQTAKPIIPAKATDSQRAPNAVDVPAASKPAAPRSTAPLARAGASMASKPNEVAADVVENKPASPKTAVTARPGTTPLTSRPSTLSNATQVMTSKPNEVQSARLPQGLKVLAAPSSDAKPDEVQSARGPRQLSAVASPASGSAQESTATSSFSNGDRPQTSPATGESSPKSAKSKPRSRGVLGVGASSQGGVIRRKPQNDPLASGEEVTKLPSGGDVATATSKADIQTEPALPPDCSNMAATQTEGPKRLPATARGTTTTGGRGSATKAAIDDRDASATRVGTDGSLPVTAKASLPARPGTTPATTRPKASSVVPASPAATSKRTISEAISLVHEGKEEIFCIRFSPNGEHIALSYTDGSVSICNVGHGKVVARLNGGRADGTPTTMVRWRPPQSGEEQDQARLVIVGSDGKIIQYNAFTRRRYGEITEPNNQLFCLDYRIDGRQFTTAGKQIEMHVYDEETQKELQTLTLGDMIGAKGHSNRIMSLKYHPTMPNIIVSGGWDKMVQFWDCREGHAVRTILGPYICGDAVDISLDGETILTGASRLQNQLQLWDFKSGQLIQSLPWTSKTNCSVAAAQFSKLDSNLIAAGGSGTGEMKLFDGKSDWANFGHTDLGAGVACYSVDFSSDGSMVAAAGSEQAVQLWRLH